MAGSSDVAVGNEAGAGERYAGLLSDIHASDPTAHAICGSIPPDLAVPASDVTAFNLEVQQDAAADAALGWDVTFADVGNSYTAADMTDDYHPNQQGNNLLGAAWLNAVENYTSPDAVPEPAIGAAMLLAICTLGRRRSTSANRRPGLSSASPS